MVVEAAVGARAESAGDEGCDAEDLEGWQRCGGCVCPVGGDGAEEGGEGGEGAEWAMTGVISRERGSVDC